MSPGIGFLPGLRQTLTSDAGLFFFCMPIQAYDKHYIWCVDGFQPTTGSVWRKEKTPPFGDASKLEVKLRLSAIGTRSRLCLGVLFRLGQLGLLHLENRPF